VGADIDPEAPLAAVYLRYLARRPDSIVGALRDIARADGAVLVHCAAGKDRTGVVVALALDAVGVDRETIVDDYVVTRERIDQIWDRLMSSATYRGELEGHDPADHAPRPETMHGVFRRLDERHGGTVEWLRSEGFGDDDLARLRERLRP
jgi:protein tyrosine/serine phosphatase